MDVNKIIQDLILWFFESGLIIIAKIVVILIGAVAINRIGNKFIEKTVRKAVRHEDREAELKREGTLIRIFEGGLRISIYSVTVMMILSEIGVNIAPVLAGGPGFLE